MSKSRAKGTLLETAIKNYFQEQGFDAERIALQGKNDIGDIRIVGIDSVFELKNCKKIELSKWVKETEVERQNAKKRFGFCIFKRRGTNKPDEQFVLMTVGQLVEILAELYPQARS